MRVLVTGAGGFLGQSVVTALLSRGHEVRAMVRPASDEERLPWRDRVEIVRADLRAGELRPAFDAVDALVHLAATVYGSAEAQFAGTVVATERLLAAMAESETRRLVLASSFAVYDWSRIAGRMDENSPLDAEPFRRDGYAVAKVWEERIVRRTAAGHGWPLTVLRPGYVWGKDHEWPFGAGLRAGSLLVVMSSPVSLPLTHVGNCADCFAATIEDQRSVGRTYNVVDGFPVTPRQYAVLYGQGTGRRVRVIPVPYAVGMAAARVVESTAKAVARGLPRRSGVRLPSVLVPIRFEARFKPVECGNDRLSDELGWRPPHDLAQCLRATYGEGEG